MGPAAAPSARCATSTLLPVFTWGRSVTWWRSMRSRIVRQLRSSLSASSSSAGVSRRSSGWAEVRTVGEAKVSIMVENYKPTGDEISESCAELGLAALSRMAYVSRTAERAPPREGIFGHFAHRDDLERCD